MNEERGLPAERRCLDHCDRRPLRIPDTPNEVAEFVLSIDESRMETLKRSNLDRIVRPRYVVDGHLRLSTSHGNDIRRDESQSLSCDPVRVRHAVQRPLPSCGHQTIHDRLRRGEIQVVTEQRLKVLCRRPIETIECVRIDCGLKARRQKPVRA